MSSFAETCPSPPNLLLLRAIRMAERERQGDGRPPARAVARCCRTPSVRDLGDPQARAVGDAERGFVFEARRGFEERSWAESTPTAAASGRTEFGRKVDVPKLTFHCEGVGLTAFPRRFLGPPTT
jgi:hypothetical protein